MDALTTTLNLTVNGDALDFELPLTVFGLVERLGLDMRKVAVELNREIVPRSTYGAVMLQSGDVLEIVHFIGGG
jgi:thiamine biosynthesis protein ThiS